MKIKTRWLVSTYGKDGMYSTNVAEFYGFFPTKEQISEYCIVNDWVIISMQRLKYGKFGFEFRK